MIFRKQRTPWGSLCAASWGTPFATLFHSIKAHSYAIHSFKTQNIYLSVIINLHMWNFWWWFIGVKHVRFWIHRILWWKKKKKISNFFFFSFLSTACFYTTGWWVTSNAEVIMTCFKAVCQYIWVGRHNPIPSRSQTKDKQLITLLSEISCTLEAPVRLSEFK